MRAAAPSSWWGGNREAGAVGASRRDPLLPSTPSTAQSPCNSYRGALRWGQNEGGTTGRKQHFEQLCSAAVTSESWFSVRSMKVGLC